MVAFEYTGYNSSYPRSTTSSTSCTISTTVVATGHLEIVPDWFYDDTVPWGSGALSPLSAYDKRRMRPEGQMGRRVPHGYARAASPLVRPRRCISKGVKYQLCDTRVI